jgi:tetratricopeptide (TPR) repeat protein
MTVEEAGVGRAAWRARVRALMRHDPGAALDVCEAALAEHARAPELHVLRGDLLDRLGRREEAGRSLEAALGFGPGDGRTLAWAAQIYARQGRSAEALDLIRRAGAAKPALQATIGRLLLDLDEIEQADAELTASGEATLEEERRLRLALQDDAAQGVSAHHRAMRRVALELLRQGQAEAAAQMLEALAEARPGYAAAWLGWRGALEAAGRADAAVTVALRWDAAAPGRGASVGPLLSRRFSPTGLLFDPADPVPTRPREELFRRVGSPAELRRGDDALLPLDPGGAPLEFDPVISLKPSGEDRRIMRLCTAESWVAGVTAAAVVGRGLVLTRDGYAVEELIALSPRKMDAWRNRRRRELVPDRIALGEGPRRVKVFDEPAFLLTGPTDGAFGDWMLNFLPKLALYEAARLDCRILVGTHCPLWAMDLLASMGVGEERLLFHDARGISLFPKLYTPSWPLPVRSRPMADLFAMHRRVRRSGTRTRERLYLTREHVGNRRLANEAQVRALFEARGFRTIEPGRMSLEEVLATFARPAMVAGAYGSAFLNLAFASEAPVGLALMPPEPESYLDELTLWLGALGVRFGYLRGAPAGDGDWMVSPGEVEAALDGLLQDA